MDNNIQRLDDDNDIIYSDNFIKNYEEQACCHNIIFSTFGNTSIFNYINDICFKDIPINDQEIINQMNQEVKTPLCSNKKNTPKENENNNNNAINLNKNDIIDNFNDNIDIDKESNNFLNIGNENNNILINNEINYNLIRNSLASNPSNDSAAEPIMAFRRNYSMDNQLQKKNKKDNNNNGVLNRNQSNFFTSIAGIFKEFFNKKEKNDNDNEDEKSESELSLKKRPILKRLISKDVIPTFKSSNNNFKNYKIIPNNNKNINLYKNSKNERLYDDILMLKTAENDNENLTKLVSVIPQFIVKEKNKNNECNNKHCPICLGEFMIGEKESSLPCLHFFHSSCIEKWLKRSKFCPVCKLEISWESPNPDI